MFNWVFNRFYFLSRVIHQSRDIPGVTSVWGVSAVAILYYCMRVVDKKVNYAGLLCCRDL